MPTNTSSPVKRPGLGRRAVSSHAVFTREASSDLSESHNSKALVHPKPHRTHVVGGGHRNHHRNPSFGKQLNKFQRFQLVAETTGTAGRNHHRKKSAPATPVASPKGQGHVRWDGDMEDHPRHSMKRNNSTPALRRYPTGVVKKAPVADRPHSSANKKKSVGFELGEVETDDADWEDTTQSPESTRRNSVVPSNHSAENPQVLIDPLTFVKRPYPQMPRATSLPDSITNKFVREDTDEDEDEEQGENPPGREENATPEDPQSLDQGDKATRILSPSHSAKAPPAMSSISAMAKPTDSASRSTSSLNLAAGQDGNRRTFSSTNLGMANVPGSHPQATSSSMEGGVSRFIMNNKSSQQESPRTDSDPNTPSSFLPHYHPETPPSPNRVAGKPTASPARPRGADLPSRTQQKLWLQRTATLNNSPPDNGVPTTATPSAIDPTFMVANHARSGTGSYDASRTMNGSVNIRKAYEKMSLELMVVRRFQSPTSDSFHRLRALERTSRIPGAEQRSSTLGNPVKSAPSLTLLQHGRQPSRLGSSLESRSQVPDSNSSTTEDPATHSESTETTQNKLSHPSHRILPSSDEATHGLDESEEYPAVSQTDLMIRRMWESREVATSG